MGGGIRSQKQEREQLASSLRSSGSSWVEVAEALRESYRVNARVAFRYAHGWSQRRAAEEWNNRWPDEVKTFKNFSYWESWPGSTGHSPSFDNFCRLAELYECSVSDLLVDLPNFRHLDAAGSVEAGAEKKRLVLPGRRTLGGGTGGSTRDGQDDRDAWGVLAPFLRKQDTGLLVQRLQRVNVIELARVILMWIQRLDLSVSRRRLLSKLSSAFALAAVSPLVDVFNPDEYEPVVRFLQGPGTFNLSTLAYAERMITNLRQQSDVIGPQLALHSVIGHRQLVDDLAKAAPAAFQQRAVSAYAELTQELGWLCFNMGDYPSAQHYYDEARSAAHDAQNTELVTYILCAMSQLATWQGKPQVGIDHAAAAAVWGQQAHSPLAQAYAADVAVRAYVASNQPDKCREALDQEYAALQAARTDEPTAPWWYFYNESFYWGTDGECALKLQRPEAALKAMDKSLTLIDPGNLHLYTFTLLILAEARIQQDEIQEASSIVANVAQLTAGGASQRIVQRITEVRGLLTPWGRTKPVRDLDEQLAAYRRVVGSGNGNTNRTYSG